MEVNMNSSKKFPCSECDKIFNYKHALKMHLKKEHKIDHLCNKCDEHFITMIEYQNHILCITNLPHQKDYNKVEMINLL